MNKKLIYATIFIIGFCNGSSAYACRVSDPLVSADYKGECSDGAASGFGKASDSTSVYVGEFLNGKKHGIGLFKWPNGESAETEWKNDRCDGKGVYYWPDGSRYEGSFRNGKREGRGVYYWPDGSSYEGVWHDWIAVDTGTLEMNKKSRDPEAAKIGDEARKTALRVKSLVAFISSSIAAGAYDRPDNESEQETLNQAGKTKQGKDSLSVEKIQKYLFLLGYDTGKIDGVSGGKTLSAIRKFRLDSGLDENGGIDEAFLRVLKERIKKTM